MERQRVRQKLLRAYLLAHESGGAADVHLVNQFDFPSHGSGGA